MSEATSFEPMSPVPPMTRIFMPEPPLARMNGHLASGRVPGPAGRLGRHELHSQEREQLVAPGRSREVHRNLGLLLQIRSSHRNQDLRFIDIAIRNDASEARRNAAAA